jgi:hypothetical protein
MLTTTLKSLTIVAALLAGGTSLVMAQNGLPTGGYPSVAGGAAGNPGFVPAAQSPAAGSATRTASHHGTKHHRSMY